MPTFAFTPAIQPSLPIVGSHERFPLRRIFCVGRNYADHAAEMGSTVDKATARPFYFTKSAHALVESGSRIPYPPQTSNFHHEIELVVALAAPAFQLTAEQAERVIFGYSAGLDMTRRDLQQAAKAEGKPWDLAKDFDHAAVCSAILPKGKLGLLTQGAIWLTVNSVAKQNANLDQMIWNIAELLADLSQYYQLAAGDLLYTGTPAGVGAVRPGDILQGGIEGVGEVRLEIDAAHIS